jgi:primosomal protein N' (replication factor Y)
MGDPGQPTSSMLVEVLPDVSGLDRTFHYSVPSAQTGDVNVGTIVRVVLNGRRVRGYVVAVGTDVPEGVTPRDIVDVVSLGPPAQVVELCRWASWRYAGRLRPFLAAACPSTIVRSLPARLAPRPDTVATAGVPATAGTVATAGVPATAGTVATAGVPATADASPSAGVGMVPTAGAPAATAGDSPTLPLARAVAEALGAGDAVVRLPPADARLPLVLEVLATAVGRHGDAMILVESRIDAAILARRLGANGWPVALYPDDWAGAAAAGRVVIGTRNVAFSPGSPCVIVVLDAHAESYRSERAPTFDARVIVAERAKRHGIPVLYVTPCPSVELLSGRRCVRLERSAERSGWPTVAVLDAREEDPREGGYPSRLVSLVRQAVADGADNERPVVLVLNRKGRARLLSCGLCRTIQRCERCGAALVQPLRPPRGETGSLQCPRCRSESVAVCAACGSARLRVLRPGVSHARDQLAGLLGVDVAEMGKPGSALRAAPVVIGTEAVLHEVRAATMVGFLDLDRELLSPRFRAAEQALVLVARAARLVGRRGGSGRLVLRTAAPDHEVVRAAQTGDPDLVSDAERRRRLLLGLPPEAALAELSGPQAAELAARLPEGLESSPLGESGSFLVRAPSSETLADAFAALVATETGGWADVDARVEVDPTDV